VAVKNAKSLERNHTRDPQDSGKQTGQLYKGLTSDSNSQKESVDSGKTPGLIFGASNVNEELCFESYGKRVFGDPLSEDLGPDSIFWICSQTKMLTAVGFIAFHLNYLV
jgi:hypothetical protein